ncbi:Uncharacterised protein [Mycobacteroides abscessus subsp. abscessus]|nr:Uncharacterised protein [Mycobacteroides abscessus subsp. abscessus]
MKTSITTGRSQVRRSGMAPDMRARSLSAVKLRVNEAATTMMTALIEIPQ